MHILTTLGEWWKRFTASPPPEQYLQTALKRLLRDDQQSHARWKYINCYLPALSLDLKVEELPGAVEAQTRIFEHGIEIVVDVRKVQRLHDCLEVVIGHELKHADDAFTMGLTAYIEKVRSEGDKDWWHKDVETSAVAFEDRLRARLRTNPIYKSIAPTRAEQNRRHHL